MRFVLILMGLISSQLNSQTLIPQSSAANFWPDVRKFKSAEPSPEDLYSLVSMSNVKLGQVNRPQRQLGCQIDYDITRTVNMENDFVCMMPSEISKTEQPRNLTEAQEIVECGVDLENDANLMAMKNQSHMTKKKSNDVGYTFGYFGKCSVETQDRITIYELNSKLYTERIGPKQDGLIPIKAYEIQKASVTNLSPTNTQGLNQVTKVGIRYDTNKGKGPALGLQEQWHDQEAYKNLRYKAIQGDFSRLTAEAQVGLQKFVAADIGKLKCMATGTAMVGMNSEGKPMMSVDFRGELNTGSLGGRNASTPLAYAAFIQNYLRTGGEFEANRKLEGGISILVTKSSAVTVGAGIGNHRTNAAREIKKDNESIKTIFVRFSKAY